MSTSTRAVVEQLHEAYRNGDGERVAAFIHDDIDWCIYGPARIFPFEGPRHGKAQRDRQPVRAQALRAQIVIVEGNRAATMVRTAFEQRTTGRILSLRLVNFLRVQDGQVIEFKEFSDTFDVVEQAMGAWLEVPAITA